MNKESIHQDIMNKAYNVWQKNKDRTKEDFWNHLNYQQRVAVSLGNLNQQVLNGGFEQWKYNQYYEEHYEFLTKLLWNLKPEMYPCLVAIKDMLVDCNPIFEELDEIKESNFDDEKEKEDRLDDNYDELTLIDNKYYKMDKKDILKEMETLVIQAGKEN